MAQMANGGVTVQFVKRANGPRHLVCDAEVLFNEGPLAGMKLVGFQIWTSAEGERYVTLPARPTGGRVNDRFFEFLRPQDGTQACRRAVRDWVLQAYNQAGVE